MLLLEVYARNENFIIDKHKGLCGKKFKLSRTAIASILKGFSDAYKDIYRFAIAR
jgi:hypothetical protein